MISVQTVIDMIWPFAVAFAISFLLTPLVRIFAQKVGAMDVPKDARRMHSVPIPRIGGLAIFFGFLISALLFANVAGPQIRSMLIGAAMIVVVGVIDDIISLNAWVKLIFQIIAAAVPVVFGNMKIYYLTNFFTKADGDMIKLGFLSVPITIFWIVAIVNAVNLIDGLDGLAVGVSSIASITMLVIALLVSEPSVALIMAALAGACIGFLPYNANPAKIFMGDTGALFLGYILGCMSIQGFFKFYAIVSFIIPFLILAFPIIDTFSAIVRRVAAHKSPFSPDRKHLHHRLIDMGFSQKQAVALLYMLSGMFGLVAVALTGKGRTRIILLVIAAVFAVIFALKIFEAETRMKRRREDESSAAALMVEEPYGDPEDEIPDGTNAVSRAETEGADTTEDTTEEKDG